MRGVSRVTGHHLATIARYYQLAGEHANLLTATSSLQDLGPHRIELDEFWAFVRKKPNIVRTPTTRTVEIGGRTWLSGAIRG